MLLNAKMVVIAPWFTPAYRAYLKDIMTRYPAETLIVASNRTAKTAMNRNSSVLGSLNPDFSQFQYFPVVHLTWIVLPIRKTRAWRKPPRRISSLV